MWRVVAGAAALAVVCLVFVFASDATSSWLPSGYRQLNSQVAYRWTSGGCAGAATNGCWHAQFVTRYGCSAGLSVILVETRDRLTAGEVAESDANPIAPFSPVELEFDADVGGPLGGTITHANCAQLNQDH